PAQPAGSSPARAARSPVLRWLPVERSRSVSGGTSPTPLLAPRGSLCLCSAPCEQRFLLGRLLALVRAGLRSFPYDRSREAQDVLGDLRLTVRQEERYSTVEGVHHTPAVAD